MLVRNQLRESKRIEELRQYGQHLHYVERVAEEYCACHQQPETRTWIVQRNEVVPSDKDLGEGSWRIALRGTFRRSPVAIEELPCMLLSSHNELEMEIICGHHLSRVPFMLVPPDDQHPLFVTELVEQRPLITSRGFQISHWSLALDVARALELMHCSQPSILHRDVKSDIFLLKRGHESWIAKVYDFGAANFRRHVMTPNQGTPLYSAPESSTTQHSELVSVCLSFADLTFFLERGE